MFGGMSGKLIMFESLYLFSALACILAIARIMPNHTFLIWIPFALLMQLGFLAIVYGVMVLVDIGFTLHYGILINVLLFTLLGVRIHRDGAKSRAIKIRWSLQSSPKPICSKRDLVIWAVLLAICLFCSYAQFGFPPTISFLGSDAAAHASASFKISQGEVQGAQYLSHLFSGSLMACFSAFIERDTSFIIFEASEIFLLFLSGISFYSLLVAACKKLNLSTACVLVALYVVGYPLTNMLFGFSYLGLSVTSICVLLFACVAASGVDHFFQKACAVSILLYEVIISYSLFVPPIYLGIFILLIMFFYKCNLRFGKSLMALIGIFAIPICFGYLIVYSTYFITSDNTVGGVIAGEGGAFRDLYAGFIFIAPLAIYGFFCNVKERRLHALSVLTVVFVLYVAALFALCALEVVSTYYYFKLYYVLWLLVFANAACGIEKLICNTCSLLVSYALVWGSVFLFAFTDIDTKLNEARPNLNPTPIARMLFPVYSFNVEYVDLRQMSEGTMELLRVAEEMRDDDSRLTCVSNDVILRWWSAIFGGDYHDFKWWGYTDEEMIEKLKEYDYALVSFDDPLLKNQSGHTYLDALSNAENYDFDDPENVILSNESGMIVKTPR